MAELCAELGIHTGWEAEVAQTPEHQIKTRRRRRTAFLEDDSGAPGSAEKFLSAVTPKVRFDPSTPVVAHAATPSPRSSKPAQQLEGLPSMVTSPPPQPVSTAAPSMPDAPKAEAEAERWSTVDLSEPVGQTEPVLIDGHSITAHLTARSATGLRRRSHSVRTGASAKDGRGSADAADSPSRLPTDAAAGAPSSNPDWTVDIIRGLSLMEQLLLLGLDRHGNLPHNGLMDDSLSKALRAAVLCELALDGSLCLPPADNTSAAGLTGAAFQLSGWGGREVVQPGDARMRLSTGMTATASLPDAGDLHSSTTMRRRSSSWQGRHGVRGQADAIIREALSLLLRERGEDVALPPCEWMEDLLEQGSGGTGSGSSSAVGLGNLRRRLGRSLVDQQICDEKKESGLFFNTVRYRPTWRWKDESMKDESSNCTASASRADKIEKSQAQQQQRWTSREALVEQLQDWLLQLPGESCSDTSSAATSQARVALQLSAAGRMAALCGLAEVREALRASSQTTFDVIQCASFTPVNRR